MPLPLPNPQGVVDSLTATIVWVVAVAVLSGVAWATKTLYRRYGPRWSRRVRLRIRTENLLMQRLHQEPARAVALVGRHLASVFIWGFVAFVSSLGAVVARVWWAWPVSLVACGVLGSALVELLDFGSSAVRDLRRVAAEDAEQEVKEEEVHRAKLPLDAPGHLVEQHMAKLRRCTACGHRAHVHPEQENETPACGATGCECSGLALTSPLSVYRGVAR